MLKLISVLSMTLLLEATATENVQPKNKFQRMADELKSQRDLALPRREAIKKESEEAIVNIHEFGKKMNDLKKNIETIQDVIPETEKETLEAVEKVNDFFKLNLLLSKITEQNEELILKTTQLEVDKKELEAELAEKKSLFEAGQGDRDKLAKEIEDKSMLLKELNNEITALKNQNENNEETIKRFQQDLTQANQQIQALQNKLGTKEQEILGLKEEKSQLNQSVLETEKKLGAQTEQLTKIGIEKSQLESAVESLKDNNERHQKQSELDQKKIAQLEAESLSLKEINNSLSGENQETKEKINLIIAEKERGILELKKEIERNKSLVDKNLESEKNYEEKLKLMNASYEAKSREAEKAAEELRQLQEAIRIEREQAEKAKVDSAKNENDITKLKSTLMFSILANAGALQEVEKLKEEIRQLRLEKSQAQISAFEELKQKFDKLARKYQAYLGEKTHVLNLKDVLGAIERDAKDKIFLGNMELNFKIRQLNERYEQLKQAYQESKNKSEGSFSSTFRGKRTDFPMKPREFSKAAPVKKDSSPAFGPSVNYEGSGQTLAPHSNFDENTDYSHFDRPYSDDSQDPYGRTNQQPSSPSSQKKGWWPFK